MQLLNSDEPAPEPRTLPEKPEEEPNSPTDSSESVTDEGVALDVSGKSLEFPAAEENAEDSAAESLYLYKNVYSLVPKWVGGLARLRTLKFFGNEVNLFAPEFGNLTGLECLQMKISSPDRWVAAAQAEGVEGARAFQGPSKAFGFSLVD